MSKKQFIGKVVSTKMQKTVVVELERKIQHKLYKKLMTFTKKIKADTNNLEISDGQTVKIEQVRPMSTDKHFKVIEILKEGGAGEKVKSSSKK